MKAGTRQSLALLALLCLPPVTQADGMDSAMEQPAYRELEDRADPVAAEVLDLWSDPRFQKEFLGSFGANSEIEPKVDDHEREQMQKIIPLLESAELEQAATELEQITSRDSSAVIDFTLANVYFQVGKFNQAVAYYESALEKFPSFRRAHKNLAMILVRRGKFAEAIKPLSRVIQLGGGDGLTFGLLGYAYSSAEQYVAAESAYSSALLFQPDALQWKLGLTQSVIKQSKFHEAVILCEELLANDPDRADFWMLQANAYIGLEQPLKAAQNLEMLQRMEKASTVSLYTLGDIYVNESLWDLAARAYGHAIRHDTEQSADDPLRRVEILSQRGALDQAGAVLDLVRQTLVDQLDEVERKRMLKLEARIAVAQDDGGEAVGVLEEIVALDPLDGEALMLLGRHYADQGEVERAVFYYERAGNLNDYEADAKIRHAQLLVGQSRYDEAVPLLKRAQDLQPRDEITRYLEQVERVARARR